MNMVTILMAMMAPRVYTKVKIHQNYIHFILCILLCANYTSEDLFKEKEE